MATDIDEIKTIVTNLDKRLTIINKKLNALAKMVRVLYMHDTGSCPMDGEDYFKELLTEFRDDEFIDWFCRDEIRERGVGREISYQESGVRKR